VAPRARGDVQPPPRQIPAAGCSLGAGACGGRREESGEKRCEDRRGADDRTYEPARGQL
jgi:hypothetical protein